MNISLEIDGRAVETPEGTSIWDAAKVAGIDVPVLCHEPGLRPVGVCRMCAVEVDGSRTLVAACVREAEPGMVVRTATDRVVTARRVLLDLLMSEQPAESAREATTGDDELIALAEHSGARRSFPRSPDSAARGKDESSPVIAVDHQACILCDRCIRACDEVQHNNVIGRTGKGHATRISFDLDQPMGASTCVSCGECAAACPTGALTNKPVSAAPIRPPAQLKQVDSVCPYCGVGCALTFNVDESRNEVIYVEGRDSPGNQGRLCVKGRYGFDYAMHPQRLTKPLIRVDYPKRALSPEVAETRSGRGRKPGGIVDYAQVLPAFREATWEEALDLVASRLLEIRDKHGPGALAGFGSAKCSNEEAYLFQKLVRTAFRTNNVDHCTRLCHASSVAALQQTIGSAAVTTTFGDIKNSDVALITGSNTTENHPVAATFFKDAAARGTRLIVVDPRRSGIADHAWRFCQIRPGTDVAFYNAMMNVIINEGLVDDSFIERRTTGYEELRALVERYTPERVAPICGVSADIIREVAREYGRARSAITFWGMGMSQHVHGTDNCRAIIALALITGNIGRPGAGLHPLRGQNNVQGASDAGLIPMSYPGYLPVTSDAARERFEKAWGVDLDPNSGLTSVEIIEAARDGHIKGMYMLGENPFLSEPNINEVRKALTNLEFLAVQDIFLTETAEFADVILPATSALEKTGTYTNTDRRVQIGRPAIEAPGEARLDWEVICDISNRMGYPMNYSDVSEAFDEMVSLTDAYAGLDYDNLGAYGKLYPCPDPEHSDGTIVMFEDEFPTPDGRAKFIAVEHTGGAELPDEAYPMVLVTGRVLEHWHTGVMTRRSKALNEIRSGPFVEVNPADAVALGLAAGDRVVVVSRRGEVELPVNISERTQSGSVFIPFHFREAAANVLTTDLLDPFGKIPEFKFCAVRVEKAT